MKVFLDTNILLDIYHLSGSDLEELRKLTKMVQKDKVELLVSTQVVDEFWRNRERIIADAMKAFRETKALTKIPNIIRIYPESKELKVAADRVNSLVRELAAKAGEDITHDALKADKVIRELFSAITVGEVGEETYARALRRSGLGNPPGKKGSIGDAVNWEWLLEQEFDFWDDELVLISSDGDYESELRKGMPREFLVRQWESKNSGIDLVLCKSLTDFLSKKFPDIELDEELDKIEEIERLEGSPTFEMTHKAIAALNKYDDFKDSEIKRIIEAYLENSQILWILGDQDVKEFAKKIVGLARSEVAAEIAAPLIKLLEDSEEEDDDIPF